MSPGWFVVLWEKRCQILPPEHTKSFETAAAACPAARSNNYIEPSQESGTDLPVSVHLRSSSTHFPHEQPE